MRLFGIVVGGLVLAMAASCGGSSGTGNTGPTGPGNPGGGSTSNAIGVGDNFFSPAATTVAAGSTVTWTWNGGNQHNVTFDDGAKSATQTSGTYARTFTTAGSYAYHCTVHGSAMSGTVNVQ